MWTDAPRRQHRGGTGRAAAVEIRKLVPEREYQTARRHNGYWYCGGRQLEQGALETAAHRKIWRQN